MATEPPASPVHWVPGSGGGGTHTEVALPVTELGALMARLGGADVHAVAEGLLRLVGAQVPMAQCTIFAFDGLRSPRTVAMGDRSRTRALPAISEAYVQRFHRLDPALALMRQEEAALRRAPQQALRILLQRQRAQDISHPEYRAVCYDQPRVAERLAVLVRYDGGQWMSVNFYRGVEHGPLDDAGLAVLEAFAPFVAHAVRLHHTGHLMQQHLSEVVLARATRRCPALTKRDLDVLRCLLKGQSNEQLADSLGLTLASAQTYVKRTGRKLGVGGPRELLAWLMEPAG